MTDDLGFFAAPRSATAAGPTPFGAAPFGTAPLATAAPGAAPSDVPFGTPGRTVAPVAQPVATPRTSRRWLVALVLVVTLSVVAVVGALLVRTWRATGAAPKTTVSTPAQVGDLVRTTATAPTLAAAAPDVVAAVPLRTPRLATYARGPVTAEVLVARPVDPLDQAAQSRVLAGFTRGMERLTEVPPILVPAAAGILSGPFSCSQVDMADTVRVACVGTSSGAVVLVLVSGADYVDATKLAADLRAGVARRS
jgi:hypothetical protein